jgi:hypothetical protein
MSTHVATLPEASSARLPGAWHRRAERHAIDLLARYACKGLRGTVLLKDLTHEGARIEGLEALRQGDGLTLLLPDAPPVEATVAWAVGRAAGLKFDEAIAEEELLRIVRDFAPASHAAFTPAALARRPAGEAHPGRRACA